MSKKALLAAAVLALAVGTFGQEAVSPETVGSPAPAAEFSLAHLSYVDGRVFLQRATELGFEETTLNTPIGEGDRIGTDDGRAEIAFGGYNFARIDERTKIDVQTLPREGASLLRLRHWSGNVILDLGSLDREKGVEVLTPGATFYFLEKGRYRIDVAEDGRVEISVYSGLVEAAAEEGSILIKDGQRLSVTDGRFNGRPSAFFGLAEDSFDRWNGERAALVKRASDKSRLPSEITEYEYVLDENGRWVDVEPFGPVWVPAGMAGDWRPYSLGRWTWLRPAGWCWVPYEPWGWCTYHYGRWHWAPSYGWYWIPMSGWGPAWVSWWWDDYYFGWAPMSWWGYPGVIYGGQYWGHGWDGDYPHDSRALTVVRKDQLQSPDVRQASLKAGEIRALGRINLSAAAPNVRPAGGGSLRLEPLSDDRDRFVIRKNEASLARDSGANPPSTPRLIRPADRPRAGDESGPVRIEKRSAEASGAPSSGSTERRIRKSGGDAAGMTGFPSRIARENSGTRIKSSGSLMDKFYRVFKEAGKIASGSSPRTSATKSPSSRSSSSPRKSGSSTRSGSSGKKSSGTVRKK